MWDKSPNLLFNYLFGLLTVYTSLPGPKIIYKPLGSHKRLGMIKETRLFFSGLFGLLSKFDSSTDNLIITRDLLNKLILSLVSHQRVRQKVYF
jgi:hypothetical protein